MTKDEINNYKNSWKPGHKIIVGPWLYQRAKNYCKNYLHEYEWSIRKNKNKDSYTFSFEKIEMLQNFQMELRIL